MEPNITLDSPGIAWTPRVTPRLLGQIALGAAAAVLVVALAVAGSESGSSIAEGPPADLQRWQALAASYDGPPVAALAAQSARWDGIAAAHAGLSAARSAEAARWAGLAGTEAELTPGQAAYAARLSGSAAADGTS